MGYFYVFATLILTVYGQIILKWRMNSHGQFPEGFYDKLSFLLKALLDPYIITGFISAFIASLFWMAAMTQFEITKVYPFMTLAPAMVFIIGVLVLGETYTIGKLLGLLIIAIGIIITVKF
ncbi:MAG: EamA family transporter [Bacteroidetes bacterium]|nr:EamA family transporter [Bacteroidota bacterium]